MIPYILYSAIVIAVFLVFYKVLLQQETFFKLNRYLLLICMVMAFVLPLVPVPQQFSFRKAQVSVMLPKVNEQIPKENVVNTETAIKIPAAVADVDQIIDTNRILKWVVYLYWFGVIIFGLNFLLQIVVLLYKAYANPAIVDGKFRIVEIPEDKAPCSFANTIFINPEKYDWETYNQVLLHEKIHIEEKHTFDLF
jgi:hypothetical protein